MTNRLAFIAPYVASRIASRTETRLTCGRWVRVRARVRARVWVWVRGRGRETRLTGGRSVLLCPRA